MYLSHTEVSLSLFPSLKSIKKKSYKCHVTRGSVSCIVLSLTNLIYGGHTKYFLNAQNVVWPATSPDRLHTHSFLSLGYLDSSSLLLLHT